jgi:glycerophosphoryl diester phosphodiesterase
MMKDLRWLLTIPVAHRGYHAPEIPENSIAAFHEAIENGFTIELDVHKTRDDVLVVFHDDTLSRLTSSDKKITDCSSSELRNLVLQKTDERIPAFSEVLDYVHGQVGLLVEIKTHPDLGKVEELLSRQLDAYAGTFAVVSFDPWIVRWFYKNRPSYIRGQISGGLRGKKLPIFQQFFLKNLFVTVISRPDFIAYEYTCLNPWIEFLARMVRTPVLVWTIRDPDTLKKCRDAGRNSIFEGFRYPYP